MKRSCQRQTQFLDLLVQRMISLVPIPSTLNSTISTRQTCLCGALLIDDATVTGTKCRIGPHASLHPLANKTYDEDAIQSNQAYHDLRGRQLQYFQGLSVGDVGRRRRRRASSSRA